MAFGGLFGFVQGFYEADVVKSHRKKGLFDVFGWLSPRSGNNPPVGRL
jgi:hypothetical protein